LTNYVNLILKLTSCLAKINTESSYDELKAEISSTNKEQIN
jgi:hypothetical protein